MHEMHDYFQQALVTLLGAVVTGTVAVIGAWVNAYVAKTRQQAKDYGAAEEKIRSLQRAVGLPPSPCLKSVDEIHKAIRDIEKAVNNGD